LRAEDKFYFFSAALEKYFSNFENHIAAIRMDQTAWEMAMTTSHQRSILKIQKPAEVLIWTYKYYSYFFQIVEFYLVIPSLHILVPLTAFSYFSKTICYQSKKQSKESQVKEQGDGGKEGDSRSRARICKRLKSPEIDSKESIPPGWETIPGLLKMFT
jgi:hypothetical protein